MDGVNNVRVKRKARNFLSLMSVCSHPSSFGGVPRITDQRTARKGDRLCMWETGTGGMRKPEHQGLGELCHG